MKTAKSLRQYYGLGAFLRDKTPLLVLAALFLALQILLFSAFHLNIEIIIASSFFWTIFVIIFLAIEYFRRRSFYENLLTNIENLDQAFLVLETLEMPNFYDGRIIYQALENINRSMLENVKKYATQSLEFQEYIEMWIHEVKTPLATLTLLSQDPKINQEIKNINDYVEQVLYFARAENAERDYLIGEVSLEKVIGSVATRNREILLAKHIDFEVDHLDYTVHTDAKWLEFVLNQILTNSIKYGSTAIEISAHDSSKNIILTIRDNGIGINEKDLPRVFEKSFTGNNGRTNRKSTGMGLYIAKTLCQKLGHQISIRSQLGKYTEVIITFAKNNYFRLQEN